MGVVAEKLRDVVFVVAVVGAAERGIFLIKKEEMRAEALLQVPYRTYSWRLSEP